MNTFLKIALILLGTYLVIVFVVRQIVFPKLFSWGDPFLPENIVLIDTVGIDDSRTLYWFKYEGGISSSTISYMSISDNPCDISKENALLTGDLIYRIDTVKKDSIFIVTQLGFKILHPSSRYKFINEDFSYDKKYKAIGLKKEFFLSKICPQ